MSFPCSRLKGTEHGASPQSAHPRVGSPGRGSRDAHGRLWRRGRCRGSRASPPPRLPPRLGPRRRRTERSPPRSPSPAACAPTESRGGRTRTARAPSTSRSCGHSGSTCPGSGRSRRVPATSRSRAPGGTRSPRPIGLTTSGAQRACARTVSVTSPTRRSRATTSGSTSRRASTRTLPVHERGEDLHEVDTGGSAL